ncbi:hypothetical protein NK6_1428 [Bradyrhizobium diazoefficiens]|uniref:Uncharacterized protein n=1 Tax=Bradyrhizobium diazoefficiens TaxID=1355477 RepID=A0A0E4FRG0_9BRAD|nr:hypothetical protein NK6_1428 [Bradyrhizobium diazoefficiens]
MALACLHDRRSPRHARVRKWPACGEICGGKGIVSDASRRALSTGEPSFRHGSLVLGDTSTKMAAAAAVA